MLLKKLHPFLSFYSPSYTHYFYTLIHILNSQCLNLYKNYHFSTFLNSKLPQKLWNNLENNHGSKKYPKIKKINYGLFINRPQKEILSNKLNNQWKAPKMWLNKQRIRWNQQLNMINNNMTPGANIKGNQKNKLRMNMWR